MLSYACQYYKWFETLNMKSCLQIEIGGETVWKELAEEDSHSWVARPSSLSDASRFQSQSISMPITNIVFLE